MSVADLRARALAHNATVRFTYPICLDDDKRRAIDEADKNLKTLHTQHDQAVERQAKAEKTQRRTLGEASTPGHDEETARIDEQIKAAEADLDRLETDALTDSVLLKFRRLTPDEYQALWDSVVEATNEKPQEARLEELKTALRVECYVGTEDADGNDLGIAWGQAVEGFINSGDMDNLGTGLILFNRTPSTVPFNQANSGLPATS